DDAAEAREERAQRHAGTEDDQAPEAGDEERRLGADHLEEKQQQGVGHAAPAGVGRDERAPWGDQGGADAIDELRLFGHLALRDVIPGRGWPGAFAPGPPPRSKHPSIARGCEARARAETAAGASRSAAGTSGCW